MAHPHPSRTRELDIVVYGATGFAGALVAAHLATHAPDGVRIGLAGRSVDRLDAVRSRLAVDWPLLVADADDPAALADIASAAHVVATTVGPFARHGLPLVRACATTGTDYVDITGEVLFVRRSIDECDGPARASGARIVHSCGFDSVPSDLGVHLLHGKVAADGAGELTDTTLVVTGLSGGFSGGTVDSIRLQLDTVTKDRALRRVAASPYSLSPSRDDEPDLGRQDDFATLDASTVDSSLRGRLAPFLMAPYNTRVVRRSNALRGYAYGREFRYREAMSVGRSALSTVYAGGLRAGLGAMTLGLSYRPTRAVLDRLLPKPGAGPDERTRRTGHFTCDLFTRTGTGARYTARVRAKGDPGYTATAVMLGEAALTLVVDRDALPPTPGGVMTPATALGDAYVDRLQAAGMELSARRLDGP